MTNDLNFHKGLVNYSSELYIVFTQTAKRGKGKDKLFKVPSNSHTREQRLIHIDVTFKILEVRESRVFFEELRRKTS